MTNMVNSNTYQFKCLVCYTRYRYENQLRLHYVDTDCGQTFIYNHGKMNVEQSDVEYVRRTMKQLTCFQCERTFTTRYNLNRHRRSYCRGIPDKNIKKMQRRNEKRDLDKSMRNMRLDIQRIIRQNEQILKSSNNNKQNRPQGLPPHVIYQQNLEVPPYPKTSEELDELVTADDLREIIMNSKTPSDAERLYFDKYIGSKPPNVYVLDKSRGKLMFKDRDNCWRIGSTQELVETMVLRNFERQFKGLLMDEMFEFEKKHKIRSVFQAYDVNNNIIPGFEEYVSVRRMEDYVKDYIYRRKNLMVIHFIDHHKHGNLREVKRHLLNKTDDELKRLIIC